MQSEIHNKVINNKLIYLLMIILPLTLAVVSFAFISPKTSSVDFHKETIQSLQTKQDNILKLSASTAGLAAGASIVLGDRVAPISNKLLDMTGYFIIILCAIMLEKYLVVLMGLISFKIIIPISCLLFCIFTILDNKIIREVALKLSVFALLAFCIIPTSIKVSSIIEDIYANIRVDNIVVENETLSDELNKIIEQESSIDVDDTITQSEKVDNSTNKDLSTSIKDFFNNAKDTVVSTVGNVVSDVKEQADEWISQLTRQLNNLIETIAIMLITTCVIPILIIFCFIWLIKLIFKKDLIKH